MESDLSGLACPRPRCGDRGVLGGANLRVHARYGSEGRLQLYCTTCRHTFSERRAYPFFRTRVPEETVVRILDGLSSQESIRGMAARVGVDKMTVQALVQRAQERREQVREWLARDRRVGGEVVDRIDFFLRHRRRLKRKNRYA